MARKDSSNNASALGFFPIDLVQLRDTLLPKLISGEPGVVTQPGDCEVQCDAGGPGVTALYLDDAGPCKEVI